MWFLRGIESGITALPLILKLDKFALVLIRPSYHINFVSMKHVYLTTLVALVFIAAFIPQKLAAQCTCSGGLPATPLTYSFVLAPTMAAVSTLSFPQFDPSIGTLNCVQFRDTISGVSTTGVRNLDNTAKREYTFLLTVANNISGPGISVIQPFNKTYGPDSLDIFGLPGDTITYGPDTIFNNARRSVNSTSVASYIGLGTVNFTYTINGGLISLEGGLNYRDQITTNYWGNFGLTYFWCPASPLATTIAGFTATDKGKYVHLQWQATNDQNNVTYEIQYSPNGTQFSPIGYKQVNSTETGTVSEYQYQYNLSASDAGTIYFRIKKTTPDGKVSYSIIKRVNLDAGATVGIQTYPNPVVNSLTLVFDENQTGNFMLELINITGQVIQKKSITLNANNLINLDLNSHPSKGMYFLRAKDQSHNKQYITKLLIE